MFYEVVDRENATVALCRELKHAQLIAERVGGRVLGEIPHVTIHLDGKQVGEVMAEVIESRLRYGRSGSLTEE